MKSEIIHLEITREDVEKAHELRRQQRRPLERATAACPAAIALKRATGSLWKTLTDTLVIESTAPFRAGVLPLELQLSLKGFETTGSMEPGYFDIMLDQVGEASS